MANRPIVLNSYKRLVTEIASLYEGARKALVEAYWQIGKRIVLVEQQGEIKAAYGTGLLAKLSEDLSTQLGPGFSERQLYGMRRFYLSHKISPPAAELSWTQHVELLKIGDVKQRKAFERKAIEECLKRDEIRALVRRELVREKVAQNLEKRKTEGGGRMAVSGSLHPPSTIRFTSLLAEPKDLTLHTYKKGEIASRTGTVIDCGFYVYRTVSSKELKTVTVTGKPAYAYEAVVERVIDGDTLWAVIDVGFGTQVREKLRLRGLDCPELGSEEGEAAKRFVAKLLPPGTPILLKTTRSDDKYGRYVADVFVTDKNGKEQYLNNEILQAGLAVRMGI